MKNVQIPPLATFLSGLILFFLMRLVFLNSDAVLIKATRGLAGLLLIIGIAGLIGKLFTKHKM